MPDTTTMTFHSAQRPVMVAALRAAARMEEFSDADKTWLLDWADDLVDFDG